MSQKRSGASAATTEATFCDTSGFYALLDRSDANAGDAVARWRSLVASNAPLVTTNYVVLETTALVQSRLGIAAVSALRSILDPFVSLSFVERSLHIAAMEQMLSLARRRVSLVDCSSFAFMRQNGVHRAFSFDSHFVEFGFALAGDTF